MLCVGFHKMFPITTIIAITTKNFFFIQSHSFAKFRFVGQIITRLIHYITSKPKCQHKNSRTHF